MWIQKNRAAIVLAPMEGVTDWPMRVLLTQRGGFSHCVSEFIRISHELIPDKIFLKSIPELKSGGKTPSGVPVQVQLLGGDARKLGESAAQVVRLGALGVDLNFGCPSPTVNRHDGGSTLLKYPARIYEIISRVRDSVPPELPVSAKLRLGFDRLDAIFENAAQVERAGASWITVHARTKEQGYAPPVHWDILAEVQRTIKLPLIVNGDIGSQKEYFECKRVTGAIHYMIGRGALSDPNLVHTMKNDLELLESPKLSPMGQSPADWLPLLKQFSELTQTYTEAPGYTLRRIKQWLNLASKKKGLPWFDEVKRATDLPQLFSRLTQL